jgi:hypothetical protein
MNLNYNFMVVDQELSDRRLRGGDIQLLPHVAMVSRRIGDSFELFIHKNTKIVYIRNR